MGESATSPTVSLEALVTMLVIDAYEGKRLSTIDVLGAYLHADMPKKKVLLKQRGKLVDIMCKINPEHKKNAR